MEVLVKGYTVHLLFHLLAMVVGGVLGAAAGLWWFAHNAMAMWAALGALVVGIMLLVLQGLYIAGAGPTGTDAPASDWGRSRMQPPAGGARPVQPQRGDTSVQPTPFGPQGHVDQDTRTAATDALHQRGAHPPTRRT
jgi:hypothetical protein